MERRILWKEIKSSGRRTGKQLYRKIRIVKPLGLAAMVVVFIFLSGRLAWGMAGKLWPHAAGLLAKIGEHSGKTMILGDKILFQYLFYEEEDRGSFRIFSESVLNGRLYLTAASNGQAGAGADGQEEENQQTAAGKEDLAQSVLSENASWEEGQPEDEVLDHLAWEDGFLENVLSENASFGNGTKGDAFLGDSKESDKAGNIFTENMPEEEEYLPVVYIAGNVKAIEKPPAEIAENIPVTVQEAVSKTKLLLENHYSIAELSNVNNLLSTYYIVDSITSTLPELFDAKKMLEMDFTLDGQGSSEEGKYQILIYHTHASEEYIDSRAGEVLDTVRGPGEALAEYLRGYGYTVYHDMTAYDRKDGKDNRNMAYSTARPQIEAFLEKHPEVEVIIDLHRDSGAKRVATIDGKKTAQIMLFNGLCRNASGPIADLENPNLEKNLGFSLQLNLTGRVLYPNLMFRIYLKNYRYNQHFRPRCLLVELGTDQNSVEEAYNAMGPFAEILDMVLRK